VTLAENQQGNAEALMGRGAAVALGYFRNIDAAMIARQLRTIAADRDMREAMGVAAARVTDGSGVERIVRYCINAALG
jgi:spore coat polysaccharide biosynthesis predicted glycosyltransferase SpsG